MLQPGVTKPKGQSPEKFKSFSNGGNSDEFEQNGHSHSPWQHANVGGGRANFEGRHEAQQFPPQRSYVDQHDAHHRPPQRPHFGQQPPFNADEREQFNDFGNGNERHFQPMDPHHPTVVHRYGSPPIHRAPIPPKKQHVHYGAHGVAYTPPEPPVATGSARGRGAYACRTRAGVPIIRVRDDYGLQEPFYTSIEKKTKESVLTQLTKPPPSEQKPAEKVADGKVEEKHEERPLEETQSEAESPAEKSSISISSISSSPSVTPIPSSIASEHSEAPPPVVEQPAPVLPKPTDKPSEQSSEKPAEQPKPAHVEEKPQAAVDLADVEQLLEPFQRTIHAVLEKVDALEKRLDHVVRLLESKAIHVPTAAAAQPTAPPAALPEDKTAFFDALKLAVNSTGSNDFKQTMVDLMKAHYDELAGLTEWNDFLLDNPAVMFELMDPRFRLKQK
ncbi:hypothetical protein M3Y99_01756800 [Aphelenchoides fujianensis]|nr:hypothetical protein M3Y99_01756800 [Aphelenchoides fujianensis]